MSRPVGSRNREKAAFERAWRRCAKKHGVDENEILAELCLDPSPAIRLGAVKMVLALLHARPQTIVAPIGSDAQLTFLPAEPPPTGNMYDGQSLN